MAIKIFFILKVIKFICGVMQKEERLETNDLRFYLKYMDNTVTLKLNGIWDSLMKWTITKERCGGMYRISMLERYEPNTVCGYI